MKKLLENYSGVINEVTSKKLALGTAIILMFEVIFFDKLGEIAFLKDPSKRLILILSVLLAYLFFFIYMVENFVRERFKQIYLSFFLILMDFKHRLNGKRFIIAFLVACFLSLINF